MLRSPQVSRTQPVGLENPATGDHHRLASRMRDGARMKRGLGEGKVIKKVETGLLHDPAEGRPCADTPVSRSRIHSRQITPSQANARPTQRVIATRPRGRVVNCAPYLPPPVLAAASGVVATPLRPVASPLRRLSARS